MSRTAEPEGWTSQFREIVLDIGLDAHDLRNGAGAFGDALDPDSHAVGRALGGALRAAGSDGIAYPSCRHQGGECVALFYPDRRSDEHTSELQSLMRSSYAVFCLQKKHKINTVQQSRSF